MGDKATVIVAGGCFWCTEAVFRDVIGVGEVESGYIGGTVPNPTYKEVCGGTTGHAEAIRVTFDPSVVSLPEIYDIFLGTHDPTQLNRQGPDTGSQYRSTIFPRNAEQAEIAKAYIAQLDQAHAFKKKIVTTIEMGKEFYPAEQYHQDFLFRNPTYPYIVYNDLPKLANLKKLMPELYRDKPVLVSNSR